MEPAFTDFTELADAVTAGLAPLLADGTPFAFFGHRCGGQA